MTIGINVGMTYELRNDLVRMSYVTIELESINQSTGRQRECVSRVGNLIKIKVYIDYKYLTPAMLNFL